MVKASLFFCIAFLGADSSANATSDCTSGPTIDQLRTVDQCSSALCCPRLLELQLNLVRAIAIKLETQGYRVAAPDIAEDASPATTGYYDSREESVMAVAIWNYKVFNGVLPIDSSITYPFVLKILGVDLLTRWQGDPEEGPDK